MNPFFVIILAILIGNYLLNLTVELLNLGAFKLQLPEEFKDAYDEQKYAQSQKYLRENTHFSLIHDTVMTAIILFFILSGGFNLIDEITRGFGFGNIATGLVFVGILYFGFQFINIPFAIYHTFVIEQKYGFNRTKPKTFILDLLKGWLLAVILGGAVFTAIVWFFIKTGSFAWIYCWIAVTLFEIFLIVIAPVLILPMFNKFIPLEQGDLRKVIQNYADSQNFRMKEIFKMDGSRRSSKSNAFFIGFGRFKRIALFDTLIQRHTTDELVSVLAHEIGHYKKKHILKRVIISIFTNGLMFFILSLFINNPQLFQAFKMQNVSVYASLVFFGILYTPISMVLSIAGNILSRKHEYEADKFAVLTYKKPESFIEALKKLTVNNLSNLTPHPLKVFLQYSHPPVLNRIEAIRKAEL